MSTPAEGPARPALWACRALRADGSTAWIAAASSDLHADGERFELPEADALAHVGQDALAVAHVDPVLGVVGVRVSGLAAPKAPPMWFAELPEEDASPPALSLVAFSGHDVPDGRLLDRAALRATAATTDSQLGAIRIFPATGEVDQLYVTPRWRRRHVGTVLTLVAGTLAAANARPSLWGDGQRTAEGDRLARASVWHHRAAPLTNLAPPMTPFADRISPDGS